MVILSEKHDFAMKPLMSAFAGEAAFFIIMLDSKINYRGIYV